jgi:hypothetical protein
MKKIQITSIGGKVVQELAERNIQVVPVQCLYRENNPANQFWSEVAELSNSPLLKLESFQRSVPMFLKLLHMQIQANRTICMHICPKLQMKQPED